MFLILRPAVAVVIFVATLMPAGAAEAAPCWYPPVVAPILDSFREPDCRWCPGNRGLEYATAVGQPVTAVSTGRVSFAGTIAGTVYVVVRHSDGVRTTYGNLQTERYDLGDLVIRGATVGRAAGSFHFGVRDGDRYIDPAPYLGRLVYRPRLIPNDRSRPNLAPPPRLRCGGQA